MITVRTLYKQELLLILMQQSIPIIVTGNSHNNINTFTKRTRRISSSAAAKRFPKDFFKDQHCLHPKKINRPDNKQYQQFLFDTFSTKKFIAGNIEMQKTRQIRNESGSDTPKFKQRSSTIQHVNINKTSSNKCRKVKQKIQDSCDSPLIDKYNTISPQIERNDMIQKREVQKQQKQQKNIPFTSIPFISNFNITLGQKLNMVNLINKKVAKNTKTKQIDEKQNHLVMIPCLSARRQKNNTKNEGFRIRKKLIN